MCFMWGRAHNEKLKNEQIGRTSSNEAFKAPGQVKSIFTWQRSDFKDLDCTYIFHKFQGNLMLHANMIIAVMYFYNEINAP